MGVGYIIMEWKNEKEKYINYSNVNNNVFYGCSSLTSLDLSSFNTSSMTSMHGMFHTCSKLKTIYVSSGWTTASVTSSDYMFSNCTSLVGGNGTKYNSSYTTKTYARIDTAGTPGYLTLKNS